jgi:hypothetical protein
VEQELAAGLSERKVAKFVKDDEVHPGQMLGDTALPSVTGLRLKLIDEVDYVVKATAGTRPDAPSGAGLIAFERLATLRDDATFPTRLLSQKAVKGSGAFSSAARRSHRGAPRVRSPTSLQATSHPTAES